MILKLVLKNRIISKELNDAKIIYSIESNFTLLMLNQFYYKKIEK